MDEKIEFKLDALREVDDFLVKIIGILSEVEINNIKSTQVNELFRIFHSIKGNAMAAGLNELSGISHEFENLLLKLKENKLNLSDTILEVLYQYYYSISDYIKMALKNPDYSLITATLTNSLEDLLSNSAREEKNRLKVLIIDDEEMILSILSTVLHNNYNCEVVTALDGNEGFLHCEKSKYDLILTDYRMPKMTGEQFINNIRNDSKFNKTAPVVMITAYQPNLEIKPDIWKNVFFLDKPIDIQRLKYYLKIALLGSKTEKILENVS